jgi:hypothetical protein
MPPGYGYLTRHLPRKATRARLSGLASRQASPSAQNEGETRYYTQIPRCSGLDSHNEQTPILRVPLQTGLRFHSRGYEQPPHQRACGTTNSRWPTNTAPASGGRPKAHRQVLTPVLATRTRLSQNTSTALAAYDVLCSRRRREDLDVAGPRVARMLPGCRTDSCTLARQQQFAFPRMAGGRLLRTAGRCPSPPNAEGRTGSPAQLALRHSEDDEDP